MLIIVGYICILLVSIYTLIYISRHLHIYGTRITAVLNFLTLFVAVIIYSTLYLFSVIVFFSINVNLILWKLSLIFGFISLMLTSLILAFLKEYKKIPYFPFLIFTLLLGILIGSLFSPEAVQVYINSTNSPPILLADISKITYRFNLATGLIITIFQCSVVIYYFILSQAIYVKARSKEIVKGLVINTIIFSILILMYILYIIVHLSIFRELHILLLWVNIFGVCIVLIKKPEIYTELTNKVYFINIYHKSGILLYSYEFGESKAIIDSTTWGNIIIGINHMLSEFVDTKDQIEVLKTDNSDIIVNYDDLGFAVVLITNQKNMILKKLMDNFSQDFRNKYESELNEIQDLNRLINVSEFTETKNIVEKNFHLYLEKD